MSSIDEDIVEKAPKGKQKQKTKNTPKVKEKEELKVVQPSGQKTLIVKNKSIYFYVQRSTGMRIEGQETKEMIMDGWVQGMLTGGIFEEVK